MKEYENLYNSLIELNKSTKVKLATERLTTAESKVVTELQKYIKNKPNAVLNEFVIQVDLEAEKELNELTNILNSKGLKCISNHTPRRYATDFDEFDTPDRYKVIIQC
jgi:hypothetical protein